jgi:hypothetical protein
MKIMRIFIVACFACFICNQVSAQKSKVKVSVDTIGVLCTMEDEIIQIYGETKDSTTNVKLTKEFVAYSDENAKIQVLDQSSVKWMMVGNRAFVCYPLKESGKSLQLMEILAVNEKYILLQYWWDWYYYYVIDHFGKVVESKIKVFDRGQTIGAGNNNENVIEKLKEFFGDCPELMNAFKYNYDKKQILSTNIVNIQCSDAMPIKDIIEMLNSKGWYKKK